MSTSVLRIADMLRQRDALDETCKVASQLRSMIEEQMGSAHASEKPAKDDTDVIDARKIAHKIP